MPTYDYVCEQCGHELELFQSITEAPKRKCPACGKNKLQRRIGGGAGILFKGSGFYQTDYRSASYEASAKGEREGSSPAPEASKSPEAAPKSEAAPAAPKAKPKGGDKGRRAS